MPQGTDDPFLGSSPVLPAAGAQAGAACTDPPSTLGGFLEALTSASSAQGSPQGSAPTVPPSDPPWADEVPHGLMRALRKELGNDIGDLAHRSLGGKPLGRRTAERILRAAVTLSAARQSALLSVGLPPQSAADELPSRGSPRHVRRLAPPSRHIALLRFCLELTRQSLLLAASTEDVLAAESKQLHDRVREFLQRRGQWPLPDLQAFEQRAKPIAVVLAAWHAPNS